MVMIGESDRDQVFRTENPAFSMLILCACTENIRLRVVRAIPPRPPSRTKGQEPGTATCFRMPKRLTQLLLVLKLRADTVSLYCACPPATMLTIKRQLYITISDGNCKMARCPRQP
jgi:hypothetical protein